MLKKIFLIPWFGPYPDWLNKWVANMEYLKDYGYDYKIYSNLELFEERVREVLGIEPSIASGTGKPWDYRPALGVLFAEDVKGYDFWGHTDFDCVYGRVDKFFPDKILKENDIITNEYRYICGPWTLYRNCKEVNNAFRKDPTWKAKMEDPTPSGWVEFSYTQVVNELFKVKYIFEQTQDLNNHDTLRMEDGVLTEGGREVCMAHFNRTKVWPTHIKL